MTLELLAQRIGIPYRRLRILVDAMVALGFVECQHCCYQNSAVAAAFLSGRSSPDLRPFLRFRNQISYPAWQQFETRLRIGQATFEPADEEQIKIFSEGVEAITSGATQALEGGLINGGFHLVAPPHLLAHVTSLEIKDASMMEVTYS